MFDVILIDKSFCKSLSRPIVPRDLDRFLSLYAPRIRKYTTLDTEVARLKAETWEALTLATLSSPGALAPALKEFQDEGHEPNPSWRTPSTSLTLHMSLFLGRTVEILCISRFRFDPLYAEALLAARQPLPKLRQFEVPHFWTAGSSIKLRAMHKLITCSTWDDLDTLLIPCFLPDIMTYLASLARLRNLTFSDPCVIPPRATDVEPSSPKFPSLAELSVTSPQLGYLDSFFQFYLPIPIKLQRLSWLTEESPSGPELQATISVIERHCHPAHLQIVELRSSCEFDARDLRASPDGMSAILNVSPFLNCRNMRSFTLGWGGTFPWRLSDVCAIPRTWARLEALDLLRNSGAREGRVPPINHFHILEILHGCPRLIDLAMSFDTTRLTEENSGGPDSVCSNLMRLAVGDSPISSIYLTARFLRCHTRIQSLNVWYHGRTGTSVEDKMWDAVRMRSLGLVI